MDKTDVIVHAHTRRKSKQGAAMMAVMLILLLATATAAVTVESTGYEAKASGYNRMAAQVKSISEAGLVNAVATTDRLGAQALKDAMKTQTAAKIESFNADKPADEPPMMAGGYVYRVNYEDYSSTNKPMDKESAIGPNQAYELNFSVNIYDAYISNRSIPGYTVDGRPGSVQFLATTYIARGQMLFANQRRIEHISCACIEAGPF
jgi:hypothetical protein